MPGVNVLLQGTTVGCTTDLDGNYALDIPHDGGIIFTFIGMEPQTIQSKGKTEINVVLKEDTQMIDEVVVNGYFTKNKSSFTGNAVVVKKDELAKISTNNIMQALQVFDPSFRLQEDLNAGSNPNAIPHIRVRGDSGLGNAFSETTLKNDPNMPTFIMDGYEVTAEKVYDLNMDRVESITILKDASATAIYGSRAANGVVVITTKAPETGKLRVT